MERLGALRFAAAVVAGLTMVCGIARGQTPVAQSDDGDAASSSTAERLFAEARSALLQVRTVVASTGEPSVLGSGFVVRPDGLAITNYHVVSDFALQPDSYRLQYITGDGATGSLQLLAIDVADDLALIRIDHPIAVTLAFDDRGGASLPKGESLYSLGNPEDLGLTIVEGTNSGPVDRSYYERIHFTGALNPGMSGGPALTTDGKVVGINVARQLGSQLVSFLVPGRFAQALIASAPDKVPDPASFRAEIGRQLGRRQAALYQGADPLGLQPAPFGPYLAPLLTTPWANCVSDTNAGEEPPPRASVSSTFCGGNTILFISDDLNTAQVSISENYLHSVSLNPFQFAAFLSERDQLSLGEWSRKWQTSQRCEQTFVAADNASARPPLQAAWCARAYQPFAGLYDIGIMTITQDHADQALVSRLTMRAVDYDDGMRQAKQFIGAIKWRK